MRYTIRETAALYLMDCLYTYSQSSVHEMKLALEKMEEWIAASVKEPFDLLADSLDETIGLP